MVGGCRNLSKRGQEGTEQKRPGLKGMGVGLKEQKKACAKYLRNELLGKEKTHTQTRTHVSF